MLSRFVDRHFQTQVLAAFAAMGLLFTSCDGFNVKRDRVAPAGAELENRNVVDKFSCQYQYLSSKMEVLYTHDDTVCVDRNRIDNCFSGEVCTQGNLAMHHTVKREQDDVTFFVNFSYDHYISRDPAGRVSKAQIYFCDSSSVLEKTENGNYEKMAPECLTPVLAVYDVNLTHSGLPIVPSRLFQSKIPLYNGDFFGITCDLESTDVGKCE